MTKPLYCSRWTRGIRLRLRSWKYRGKGYFFWNLFVDAPQYIVKANSV
jgi:hypothetical protein